MNYEKNRKVVLPLKFTVRTSPHPPLSYEFSQYYIIKSGQLSGTSHIKNSTGTCVYIILLNIKAISVVTIYTQYFHIRFLFIIELYDHIIFSFRIMSNNCVIIFPFSIKVSLCSSNVFLIAFLNKNLLPPIQHLL